MRTDELIQRFEGQINEWEMWDRDPTQAFDRLAEEFYRETGLMAPGKSVPMEMAATQDDDMRRQRYTEWGRARTKVRHAMLREVLAELQRDQPASEGPETGRPPDAEAAALKRLLAKFTAYRDAPMPQRGGGKTEVLTIRKTLNVVVSEIENELAALPAGPETGDRWSDGVGSRASGACGLGGPEMTKAEAQRCVDSCAAYLQRVDDSPRAARDLQEAVRVLAAAPAAAPAPPEHHTFPDHIDKAGKGHWIDEAPAPAQVCDTCNHALCLHTGYADGQCAVNGCGCKSWVAPAQAEGWQPAATPPKDCRLVLVVLGQRKEIRVAWYQNSRSHWVTIGGIKISPSYWMPLPLPPSASDAETPTRTQSVIAFIPEEDVPLASDAETPK